MTQEEMRKAAASRRRQAEKAAAETKRRNGKRARKQAARMARQRKPDNGLPPDGTGRLYTHNSRKPAAAYHIATFRGTLCKLENSHFIRWQDTVTEAPPQGKKLCYMCSAVLARKEADATAWDRFEVF